MEMLRERHCAAFAGKKLIASGDLADVARCAKSFIDIEPASTILIFDDNSELVEIDFRGTVDDVAQRIHEAQQKLQSQQQDANSQKAGPGRPKLGVVSKEVTLLPRHWEWLATQSGGASVTIRKLVDAARKRDELPNREERAREITYKFMSAMAGDEVNFEEASRALFAGDEKRLGELIQAWPEDLRNHIHHLLRTASGEQLQN